MTGDIAVPGDYDGDGRIDFAVWRSGTWWVRQSSDNGVVSRLWGQVGDVPVPGHFDSDAMTDMAVWRPGG